MRLVGGWLNWVLMLSGAGGLAASMAIPDQQPAKEKVSFSRDVLPLLSDKCFKCHGPDSGSRMANLRLDTAEGAFASRDGRWAIVPGKPKDSLVVKRITSDDSPMPPHDSGKSLTAEEKDLITRWIAEGARYGKLWSFEPLPTTVPVPKVDSAWPRDDLDRFVLDRLNREKLKPSPEANRLRWLRRVTLDLTGLPPTESEIAAFKSDQAPSAYERVVDRLLASPHFGERMAVDWLDAARYSDSYGYQSDLLMPSWPYRDWVVKAFNRGEPYSEFLTDQIAGDLRPNADTDERLATAFNRLHRQSNEGGSIAEEFKTEYAVDRVDTYGTAVLGLTVGCARCHDHKFDALTQREYFQLFAYFNSIDEYGLLLSTDIVPTPSLLLPTPDQQARLKELREKDRLAKAAVTRADSEIDTRFAAWLAAKDKVLTGDVVAEVALDEPGSKFASKAGAAFGAPLGELERVEGKSGKAVRFDGDNGLAVRGLPGKERWDTFTWSFWIQDPRQPTPVVLLHRTGGTDVGFCGFDLTLEDGFLIARVMRHWPGNAVAVKTTHRVPKSEWTHIGWSWDGSGTAAGLELYINGVPAKTEALADKIWKKINAYGDLSASNGDWCFGQRFRDAGFKGGKLDELTFASRPLSSLEIARLAGSTTTATEAQLRETFALAVDESSRAARKAMRDAQKALAEHEETIREISVMEESAKPIPAYLLARGQYDAPKTEENRVQRGVPKSLPPLPTLAENNRLTLAKWTTRPDHPLTSRVAVNRLWQMLFGIGLVETSENFGMQGSRPSHPELLDYLARRFIREGWDVKRALRHMVLSATYRQDSALSNPGKTKDPRNLLLWHGPSQRLSAEMVRDTALAASGLLNAKVGGPPVNPYQPAGIWQEFNTMSPGFTQSKGEDLYRRSLYSTWKRTTPVPTIMLFDATSREACTMRRPATNTPLQALALLNDVQFVEAARILAEKVLKASPSDDARLRSVFLSLAGREPDARELAILKQTLAEQRREFRGDISEARKLISMGETKVDPSLAPMQVAAMTVTVQAVMNSDAVVWKR